MDHSHRNSVAGPFQEPQEVEHRTQNSSGGSEAGRFTRISSKLRRATSSGCVMTECTAGRPHQKSASGRKDLGLQAIDRTRGGLSTESVALVDVLGTLLDIVPLFRQVHEPSRSMR